MTSPDLSQRDIRQRGIVPPERLAACDVTIVGVGAIGRHVALQLAAIGAGKLRLVDFDSVEVENLATQGFCESDLGRSKVEATAERCRQINGSLDVKPIDGRFKRSMAIGDVLFELGRYEAAIKAYSTVTKRYQDKPEVLEAYVRIANAYRRLNKPAEARSALAQARIILGRMKPETQFAQTTNYTRQQWSDRLDWLATL